MDYTITYLCLAFANLLCLTMANDILSVMTNKVEFRTEAPVETLPETPKDCYEFLYGRLSEIRPHGTTWTNGVSDCSNCTCDNGDIRCFFHFCNGPATGYMTPPSTDSVGENSSSTRLEELDPDTYESSGFPPHDLDDDEDDVVFTKDPIKDDFMSNSINHVRKTSSDKTKTNKPTKSHSRDTNDDEDFLEDEVSAKWPAKVLPEKWQNELSTFETSSAPSTSLNLDDERGGLPRDKDKKDRSENETHDVFKSYFCGKPCKKSCPQGFKVDPVSGCWKCKCNKCPSLLSCTNKCPMGYAMDARGCETCQCLPEISNKDIVFKEDSADEIFDFKDNLIVASGSETPQIMDEREWHTVFEDDRIPIDEHTNFITPLPKRAEEVATTDEPCNSTETRGCLDGSRKFHVGGRWSRGPCVSCKCVAPGYSECNITQCHPLYSCPHAHRYTPPGACCTLCKDAILSERDPESRSTSRVASDLISSRNDDEYLSKEGPSASDTKQKDDDDTTVKSLAKEDQSLLLLILIPLGVVFTIGILLSTTMWRRYHRDKYDINAYRPEERQKLRPVKTLQEDQSSLKHV